MPAKITRLHGQIPVPRRGVLAALRAFFARPRKRRVPHVDELSAHLRRDIGLQPEVRRPSTDPPPRVF